MKAGIAVSGTRRLLFVSTMEGTPWGGSEELWSRTARFIARNGLEVHASVRGWPQTPQAMVDLEREGVRIHFRRPLAATRIGRIANLLRRRRAIERAVLDSVRPDLVVISQGFQFEGWTWLAACRGAGVPYAVLVQAALEHWWPGDADAARWRDVFENAAWIGFVAEANRELVESQLAVRLGQAELVRNPFNVRYEARPNWPGTEDGIRLACVGRLQPSAKGQDLILRLLATARWQERPLHVTFAGKGPNADGLKGLATLLGVARVSFRDDITDIERLWEEHHALILPSRYEGLPLVIVEAMLCARPCVVTRVAGNPELIEHGVTGFVAEGVNVPALDRAMEEFWQRRDDLKAMGAAARQTVERLVPRDPPAVLGARLLRLLDTLPGSGR